MLMTQVVILIILILVNGYFAASEIAFISLNDAKIAKQAKQEANADFISIMPDETLGNWILQNLEGLPTTILVNNQAQMVGEQIQGIQSLENYIMIVENALSEQE